MLGGVAVIALPLLLFQWYGYLSFCSDVEAAEQPPWCHDRVPYLYGYVQKHYWGVGLFSYYQLKQVPPCTCGCGSP
jgi:phosphatidylinositol glycan class V